MKEITTRTFFVTTLIFLATTINYTQNFKTYTSSLSDGYHEVIYDDGSTYKGELKNGLRNGYGTMRLKSKKGYAYVGNWKNDMMNGVGTLYMEVRKGGDLSFCEKFYCDNWVDDKKNGLGFHIKHDHYGPKNKFNQPPVTYLYEGGWIDDEKHGKANSYTTKRFGLGSRITDWWMWELEYDNGNLVYEKILEHDSWWEQLMSETQVLLTAPENIDTYSDNCTIEIDNNWSLLDVKEVRCLVNGGVNSSIQIIRRKGDTVPYLYDIPTGGFLDEVFFDYNRGKVAGISYLKSICGCKSN